MFAFRNLRETTNLLRGARCLFQAISKAQSPHPDCPLECLDKHYVQKKGSVDLRSHIKQLDYVDSHVKWRNFHSDEVEVSYFSDYDKCIDSNADTENGDIAFLVPKSVLNSSMCDDDATLQCKQWFAEWPLYQEAQQVYSAPRVQFASGISRLCAGLNSDVEPDMRHLTLLITAHTFWFDDVNEAMIRCSDKSIFQAWRNNLARILDQKEDSVRRIPLNNLTNFPKEQLVKAEFCEKVLKDIMTRLAAVKRKNVKKLLQNSFHYFMDHVEHEAEMRHVPDKRSDPASKALFLQWKSGISAVTYTTSALYDDYSAGLMTVQDPFLTMAEITVTCEGDTMSFFKENMNGQRNGNVPANANLTDWHLQAAGMSLRQALKANADIRNKGLKAMMLMYEGLNPRDQKRAMTAMRCVLNLGDYQIRLGADELNPRYGWFPVLIDQ